MPNVTKVEAMESKCLLTLIRYIFISLNLQVTSWVPAMYFSETCNTQEWILQIGHAKDGS